MRVEEWVAADGLREVEIVLNARGFVAMFERFVEAD